MSQQTSTVSKTERVQTAVDWLVKELKLQGYYHTVYQAKQMEKEQIIKAYHKGLFGNMELNSTKFADKYYNDTYV